MPRDRLIDLCGLDPDVLDEAVSEFGDSPVAVVRFGRLCWSSGKPETTVQYPVMSVTKTFASVVFGIIAARTKLRDTDLVSEWLSKEEMQTVGPDGKTYTGTINPDATVAHILAMASTSPDLGKDEKQDFSYDATGDREINRLITIMDRAVQRSPRAFPGLSSAAEVARRELLLPLGMKHSEWPGGAVGLTLRSSVLDMARIGQLLLRQGTWSGRQILDPDYVYRMTHPSFEDSNTAFGYLTWLNATGPYRDANTTNVAECTPYAVWKSYPHPPTFEAMDNYGGSPFEAQPLDVGGFEAVGLGGQIISVQRGLDLVIAVRDEPSGVPYNPWAVIRPALVALDERFPGDESSFCDAYESSRYAPSLVSPWGPRRGFGAIDDEVDRRPFRRDPAPPRRGPVGLARHFNSIGIGQVLTGGADVDREGTGFSDLFLSPAGGLVRPGDTFVSQGFRFLIAKESPGQPDHVLAKGQTVFLDRVPQRRSALGLLGTGVGGSATGTVSLNYVDGTVRVPVRMPDWLFEGTTKTQPPGTVLALTAQRSPIPIDSASMWSISVPLDPTRALRSVTLPHHAGFHVFDLQAR